MKFVACLMLSVAALLPEDAYSGPEDFKRGPAIEAYGPIAKVDQVRVARDTTFKVAFDIAEAAKPGEISRRLETVARFINMHTAAGVPKQNIMLAVVVHGGAASDLLTDEARGAPNANAGLIDALVRAGVSIELCGQTAAFRDISKEDLLPGVRMSLSAMTAHALLQQQGYTLNPF